MAQRRGYALLIQAGDREISGALASGIMAARLSEAKPLPMEQARIVSAEFDPDKTADLLRVAMHREPVAYAAKAFDAEMQYGESVDDPGPVKRACEKMLVGWARGVMGFERLFDELGMRNGNL